MHTTNRSLEGLRGIAALIVVLYHMAILSPYAGVIQNGYLSVDLFFVLSGYVICSAYGSRLTNSHEVSRFLIRRFGRLWPLHVISFVLYYALLCLHSVLSKQPAVLPTMAEFASLLTMTTGFNLFDHNIGNVVTWSAGDELYVYALFAAVCMTLRKRSSVFFAVLSIIGFVIILRVDAESCLNHGPCNDLTYSFGWARCLTSYFLGALLARHKDALNFLTSPQWQIVGAVATLALVQFAAVVPAIAFAAPIVFALLIASLTRDRGPMATLLRTRPMQYLGEVSYALYLSHSIFGIYFVNLVFLPARNHFAWQAACCAGYIFASLALAHFLHRYIEVPVRERINAWGDSYRGHEVSALLHNSK
ncbi:acyltransferase family protein [Paraburkholderia sacchari]|uniref:acyltransferase family protein n=1 Tax=Paraburkholderia sacchari TaxID=159450 RepID=UPI001BCDE91D|nr:acyltransferase [Paraburkholderia sacchari]